MNLWQNKKIWQEKWTNNFKKNWLVYLSILFCLALVICLLISQGFFNYFWDDKVTWQRRGYTGQDKMSWQQFLISGILLLFIISISIYLRSKSEKTILTVYKVLWFILVILEISKISYESYLDVVINHETFNWSGILPFYTCSIICFFAPFLFWNNGNFKRYSIAFFTTIGLAAGLSNFIYLSAAGYFPLHSFSCWHSFFYHGCLVFFGLSLMITKMFIPTWKSCYEAMIPLLIFAVPAIIVNWVCYYTDNKYADYLLLMHGNWFGFFKTMSDYLLEKNLGFIFNLFVLFVVYPICSIGMLLLDWGFIYLVRWARKLFKKKSNTKPNII